MNILNNDYYGNVMYLFNYSDYWDDILKFTFEKSYVESLEILYGLTEYLIS